MSLRFTVNLSICFCVRSS